MVTVKCLDCGKTVERENSEFIIIQNKLVCTIPCQCSGNRVAVVSFKAVKHE